MPDFDFQRRQQQREAAQHAQGGPSSGQPPKQGWHWNEAQGKWELQVEPTQPTQPSPQPPLNWQDARLGPQPGQTAATAPAGNGTAVWPAQPQTTQAIPASASSQAYGQPQGTVRPGADAYGDVGATQAMPIESYGEPYEQPTQTMPASNGSNQYAYGNAQPTRFMPATEQGAHGQVRPPRTVQSRPSSAYDYDDDYADDYEQDAEETESPVAPLAARGHGNAGNGRRSARDRRYLADEDDERGHDDADERGRRGRKRGNIVTNWFTKPGKHGFLSAFLWLATFACMGIMALRVAPGIDQDGRALPEIIAFVPAAGLVSAIVLVPALLWRRKLLTLVSIVCVVMQVTWHIGFFKPATSLSAQAKQTVTATASVDDNVARLMTLNTKEGNASADDIVRIVREQHVEVLALQEVSQQLLASLEAAGLYDTLPYSSVSEPSAQDNGGVNGVWTMAPMSNVSASLLPVETSQMPAGTIQIGDKQVRFVSAHPNSPTRGKQSLWSAGLGTIGDLKDYDWTYVVMGDFNSTWDHPRFRALLGDRFVDSGEQAGEGYHFTYPSNSKIPPVIEIDHIIHDKGVTVAGLETLQVAGSDHRALLATLEA